MDRNKKRGLRDDSSAKPEYNKKHQSISTRDSRSEVQEQQQESKRPTFISYLDNPNLPPKVKIICEIIASTHSLHIEKVLEDTGIRVTTEDVEEVLKHSYSFPAQAVKFFRWTGRQLSDKHSPYSWNLVVDLLGKNCLFEAMWDAIKSMKTEALLSLATFASVFSSYVASDRVDEAIMTFEVMDQYGIPRDIVALNSLLSAICRDGKTARAKQFLDIAKGKIRPDADTYAILLEGCENEGNAAYARLTFGEMVMEIGWDPRNVPAYDSFLITLLKTHDGMHEAMKFFDSMIEKRCSPGVRFFKTALEDCVKTSNIRSASTLWDAMMGRSGFRPDTEMYHLMITLNCHHNNYDIAQRFLDEMVFNGVFPDSKTYNLLFQFLVKSRKLREASAVFNEMVKNECIPSESNCTSAIRIFMDVGDPQMAIKVWKCMIENGMSGLEDTGNFLIGALRDLDRLPEARKYAEDMIERGIKLQSSTLSKLKNSLSKARKLYQYEELLRKWKLH
ncbi:pentatricopeptide repeat-containing protein At1g77360, mitochondrial-like [Macadamia integrifolia]|uniref:pentatricopeptide repeat-containing protein At1g77360, mitochondrial-like n=1 Tax=Macadamia integrifolia TaxID=60698 RepID=UPI001C5021B3|nr:pentatricopeptide repeat-containing protein At1g77360, mitochondrial-like [Macadamia integrifolia]